MLFEELGIIIGGELSDPHLSLVNVTDVLISRDLRNAKVFVFHDDDEVTISEVLRGLKRAAPYMRGQIAERCGLRMVPDLSFSYDDTPERAGRIQALFAQIASEQQADNAESDGLTLEDSAGVNAEDSAEVTSDREIEENLGNNPQSDSGVDTGA